MFDLKGLILTTMNGVVGKRMNLFFPMSTKPLCRTKHQIHFTICGEVKRGVKMQHFLFQMNGRQSQDFHECQWAPQWNSHYHRQTKILGDYAHRPKILSRLLENLSGRISSTTKEGGEAEDLKATKKQTFQVWCMRCSIGKPLPRDYITLYLVI